MVIIAQVTRNRPTKQMILQVASKLYLEKGFTAAENKDICKILGISYGNLTFHYPQKEYLFTQFISELCDFQWRTIKIYEKKENSPLLALCIEFATLTAVAEEFPFMRDNLVSAYRHEMPLKLVREHDTRKTMEVFSQYCPDWTEERFALMENFYSGIEYGSYSAAGNLGESLDMHVIMGLEAIMRMYQVPEDVRECMAKKIIELDYRSLGRKILSDFKDYITAVNFMAVESERQRLLEKSQI